MPSDKSFVLRYPRLLTQSHILAGIRRGEWQVCLETGAVARRGRVLKPVTFSGTHQYPFIRLHWNRMVKAIALGRLVWIAGSRRIIPRGFEVHHWDGDVWNCAYLNLFCLFKRDHEKIHHHTNLDNGVPF